MASNLFRASIQASRFHGSSLIKNTPSFLLKRGVMAQPLAMEMETPYYEEELMKEKMRAIHLQVVDFWKDEATNLDNLKTRNDLPKVDKYISRPSKVDKKIADMYLVEEQEFESVFEEMLAEGKLDPRVGWFPEERF